jgi:replication factor C subunit 1
MQGMYNFPGWLGQNSKQTKSNRLLREVQQKMKLKASANKSDIRLEYLPSLSKFLINPMIERENDGIEEVINRMDYYYLNREDWDNIMDLGYQDLVKKIPTKNKTAFTRLY